MFVYIAKARTNLDVTFNQYVKKASALKHAISNNYTAIENRRAATTYRLSN